MKLTYTKQGDYLIPDITIRQPRKALGHYGRLRKTYLQNFRPILFNELVFSDIRSILLWSFTASPFPKLSRC
jgi:hypothetical protein